MPQVNQKARRKKPARRPTAKAAITKGSKLRKTAKVASQPAKPRRKATSTRAKAVPPKPVITFEVRELDPVRKCGPRTTVQYLFRVIARQRGRAAESHMVFFDRHGWYCDHGRSCVAVAHARKLRRGLPRAS